MLGLWIFLFLPSSRKKIFIMVPVPPSGRLPTICLPHPTPMILKLLDKDPGKVRGLQHDLVLNGYEIGGGSVRIHDPKIQSKIFELIGFSENTKGRI